MSSCSLSSITMHSSSSADSIDSLSLSSSSSSSPPKCTYNNHLLIVAFLLIVATALVLLALAAAASLNAAHRCVVLFLQCIDGRGGIDFTLTINNLLQIILFGSNSAV